MTKTHINAWTYVKDKIKFIANGFLWSEGHKDNTENIFSANMFAVLYKGTFSYKFCSDFFDSIVFFVPLALLPTSTDYFTFSLFISHFTWMDEIGNGWILALTNLYFS